MNMQTFYKVPNVNYGDRDWETHRKTKATFEFKIESKSIDDEGRRKFDDNFDIYIELNRFSTYPCRHDLETLINEHIARRDMGADEVVDLLVTFLRKYDIYMFSIRVTDNRDMIKNTFYYSTED